MLQNPFEFENGKNFEKLRKGFFLERIKQHHKATPATVNELAIENRGSSIHRQANKIDNDNNDHSEAQKMVSSAKPE